MTEGLIDGVRIDHVDGLSDPGGIICRRLRARFDSLIERPCRYSARTGLYRGGEDPRSRAKRWLRDWPVDGTSGYDFMEQAALILHDPAGQHPLERLWRDFTASATCRFHDEELQARQGHAVGWAFESAAGRNRVKRVYAIWRRQHPDDAQMGYRKECCAGR